MTETLTHFIGGKQISAPGALESTNPSNTNEIDLYKGGTNSGGKAAAMLSACTRKRWLSSREGGGHQGQPAHAPGQMEGGRGCPGRLSDASSCDCPSVEVIDARSS